MTLHSIFSMSRPKWLRTENVGNTFPQPWWPSVRTFSTHIILSTHTTASADVNGMLDNTQCSVRGQIRCYRVAHKGTSNTNVLSYIVEISTNQSYQVQNAAAEPTARSEMQVDSALCTNLMDVVGLVLTAVRGPQLHSYPLSSQRLRKMKVLGQWLRFGWPK